MVGMTMVNALSHTLSATTIINNKRPLYTP